MYLYLTITYLSMMKNILRLVASSRISLDIHLVRKITDKKTSNFKFSTSLSVLFSGSSYSYNIFSQCPTLSPISIVPLSVPSCSLSFFFPLPLMTSILFTSLLSALLPLPSPPYSHPFSFSPHSQVLRNIALYHIILYPQLSLSINYSLSSFSFSCSLSFYITLTRYSFTLLIPLLLHLLSLFLNPHSLLLHPHSLFLHPQSLFLHLLSPYCFTLTPYSFTLTTYSFTLNPYFFTFSHHIPSPSLLVPPSKCFEFNQNVERLMQLTVK